MTVPLDPTAPDPGDRRAEPGDATPPEPSPWPAYGQDPSAASGQDASAGYGQGSAAYGQGQGPWAAYGQGPYDTYAGGSPPPPFDGPAPVLVSFPPPARQSRVAIGFRLLLAIPHLIVLWALTIAAEVIIVIGWFAALFTGQLPEWAHIFLTGVLRWQTRLYAYLLFVTGAFPPFSLDDEPTPVRLVTQRTRLNRLAVLFRYFLLIPAGIASGLAIYGVAVLSFFLWLIALVMGRLPRPLHYAVAAVVRYQARYYGFAGMLTGEYPGGLYGDYAPPTAEPGVAADPWRLPANGVPVLVGMFQLVGAAAFVLSVVLPNTISYGNPATAFSNATGLIQIGTAYNKLTASTVKFENASQACGGQLSCVTGQDRKEAGYLQTFADAVRSASLRGQPATDARTLIGDAGASAQSLDRLATATTAAQYESDLAATGLQSQLNSVDSDYRKLIHDLTGGN